LTISEQNLQAKLNLAWNTDNARDRAHGCARKDGRSGQVELRGIEDIEELGAELNLDLFRNRAVLEQRESKFTRLGPSKMLRPAAPIRTRGEGPTEPAGCYRSWT
jgi:hypothetical protein